MAAGEYRDARRLGTVSAMPPVTPDRISLPDRYRVVRHLANGGMASVWEAHDELLDRAVAVKVLAAHLGEDERARRRFQREARAAAGLSSHPHVVTIYDVGEHRGRAFMVMEIMRGGTVGDRLQSRRRDRRTRPRCAGCARPPRRSTPPTTPASCTATSSRRTCCWTSTAGSRVADFGIARLGLGGPADADRPGARHRRLPLARAGDGRAGHGRVGPLRARRRRLRAADRARARSRPSTSPPRRAPTSRTRRRRPRARHASCPPAVDAVLERGLAKEPGRPLDLERRVRGRAGAHAEATPPRRADAPPARAAARRGADAAASRGAATRPPAPRRARRRGAARRCWCGALAGAGRAGGDRGHRAGDSGGGEDANKPRASATRRPRRPRSPSPRRTATPKPKKTSTPTPTADATRPRPRPRRPRPPPPRRPPPRRPPRPRPAAARATLQARGHSALAAGNLTGRAQRPQGGDRRLRQLHRGRPLRLRAVRLRRRAGAPGRAAEAIPVLEARLQRFDNQTGTVDGAAEEGPARGQEGPAATARAKRARFSRASATTASAACAPWSRLPPPVRASAWSMFSTVSTPNAHGTPVRSWTSMIPRAASAQT